MPRAHLRGRLPLVVLIAAWCLAAAGGASARADDPMVQVRLFSLRPLTAVTLRTESGGLLRVGDVVSRWRRGEVVRVEATSGGVRATVDGALAGSAGAVTVQAEEMRLDGRRLTGAVTFRGSDGRALFVVAALPLEAYVAGVVAAEALPGTPREALRAQAVAARSYAVAVGRLDGRLGARRLASDAPRGRHGREGYDFCDLTHCQAFRDLGTPQSDDATRATRGRLLVANGRVVAAWYHSTCGGRTVDGRDAGADPALRGVIDALPGRAAWCATSPHFRWAAELSRDDLDRALLDDPALWHAGRVRAIRVSRRDAAGRAARVEITADTLVSCTGVDLWQAIGRALGWGRVESAWFAIKPAPSGFHFEGRGLGHGVGLCQYGSIGMARAGRTMQQILAHYYGGTHLR